jgi:hypothetical protein
VTNTSSTPLVDVPQRLGRGPVGDDQGGARIVEPVARLRRAQCRVDRSHRRAQPPRGEHAGHEVDLIGQCDRQHVAGAEAGDGEHRRHGQYGPGELGVVELPALVGDTGAERITLGSFVGHGGCGHGVRPHPHRR